MPSISAPNSPRRGEAQNVDGKWINSCSDIPEEYSQNSGIANPITAARWKALRDKRASLSKFLAKHREEGLHYYVEDLRHFAITRGGLIDDEFRAEIWPVLANHLVLDDDEADDVGSSSGVLSPSASDSDFESALSDVASSECTTACADIEDLLILDHEEPNEALLRKLKQHKEWNQVDLDVKRTLARFPPNISEQHRVTLQEDLTPLIVRILATNLGFNYYQGFHDVCLTLLLVVGKEAAFKIGAKLASNGAFRNYLLKSLEDTVVKDLNLMYVILSRTEPELEKVMRSVNLGGMFALSWPLTWFSHSLQNYHQIVRCFDMFLAAHPLTPIYVTAAVVMYRRASVLSVEREMPFMHHCLNNMPHELPVDELLSDAAYMMQLMPPVLLRGRYRDEYQRTVQSTPVRIRGRRLPRYAVQLAVMGMAGAAAGYLLTRYNF